MKTKQFATLNYDPLTRSPTDEKAPNTHRSDLQLIRGVAIISVVFFHFFPMITPNGYLGVEQFFVLSGFLMTSIFGSKPITGFSCTNFYYRRIKRIMPLYLLTIFVGTVITYFVMSKAIFPARVESTLNALLLKKNIVQISEENKYFFLLESAQDFFTHTWSLCVEMQFYLISPLLFIVSNFFKRKFDNFGRVLFFGVIGLISFIVQLRAPATVAFNGTHCRLWQFTIGIISFHLAEIFPQACGSGQRGIRSFSTLALLGSILITFAPFNILDSIARPVVTVMTGCLIYVGSIDRTNLLKNRTLEYLGDISFAWYLVHWPVNCLSLKCFYDNPYALIIGILISLIVSTILHETFEKFYQSLEKLGIFILLLVLYASIGVALLLLSHKVQDEVMELNERFDSNSFSVMHLPNCHKHGTTEICKFENEDYGTVANYTILLIGNSYACNAAAIINKHFSKLSKEMFKLCSRGCEVLSGVKWWFPHCHKEYEEYINAVKTIKPDVLFILVRHIITIDRAPIFGNISNDGVVIKAVKRLQEFENIVSTKIYLLDSTPHVALGYVKRLNLYIKEGKPIKTSDFLDPWITHHGGQRRMKEIAGRCKKCELFTYLDELNDENGEMELVRDDNKLAYWSNSVHLTPAGIERISPVYERLAENLANETKMNGVI